jgi:hypothetical protein
MQPTSDNLTPTSVDRAVREVLAEMKGRVAGGNGIAVSSGGVSTGRVSSGRGLLVGPTVANGVLVVDEPVLTLASLEGRLDGVSRVVAGTAAIVTPAVRDELRKRDISLQRNGRDRHAAEVNVRRLVFASARGRFDTDAISRALRAVSVELETIECHGLTDTVSQLAERVARDGVACVVVTSRPAAVVCLANRHAGVRAVAAASVDGVDRAVAEVGANLLALDVVGASTHGLRMAVRRFAELSRHNCPAEFAAHLG